MNKMNSEVSCLKIKFDTFNETEEVNIHAKLVHQIIEVGC
jgi:hypothetical protein